MAALEPAAAYLLSLNEGPSEAGLTLWFVEGTKDASFYGGAHVNKSDTSPKCDDCILIFNQSNPHNKQCDFTYRMRPEAAGKQQFTHPPIAKPDNPKGKDHRATQSNKCKPSTELGEREDQRLDECFKKPNEGLIS
jgi:hypothetical protein